MNQQQLDQILQHFNITVTLTDLLALVSGNPVGIQVDPANIPNVLGKTLTISFQQNSVQLQLH